MAARIVTIGNFDGVHVGHAALLARARSEADALGGGRVVAMAFDPHPASVLRPGREPARLTTFERRAELLRELGADEVVRLEPTRALLENDPEAFIRWLMERSPPTAVAAKRLGLSPETVRTHTKAILARLGAHDRAHAVAIALRGSLIE